MTEPEVERLLYQARIWLRQTSYRTMVWLYEIEMPKWWWLTGAMLTGIALESCRN